MKLVLHYLSFDTRRWRALLLLLWGAMALYLVLLWYKILNEGTLEDHDWEKGYFLGSLLNTLGVCRIVIVLCGAMLCMFAGAADSPARGKSWQRTRPGRGWRLGAARVLFILLTIALPFACVYGLELTLLKFNAATVAGESLQMLLFAAAAGVTFMIWAFTSPGMAGLFLGAALTSLSLLLLYTKGLLPAGGHDDHWPHPALAALLFSIPCLWGIGAFRRSGESGRKILSPFLTGVTAVLVIGFTPRLTGKLEEAARPGKLRQTVFPGGTWSCQAVEPPGSHTNAFAWSLRVKGDFPDVSPFEFESALVSEVSWRGGPAAEWSPWQPVQGNLGKDAPERPTDPLSRRLSWSPLSRGDQSIPAMVNGELRFKAKLLFQRKQSLTIPPDPGAFASGDGWTYRILDHKVIADSFYRHAVYRRAWFARWEMPDSMELQGSLLQFREGFPGPWLEKHTVPVSGFYHIVSSPELEKAFKSITLESVTGREEADILIYVAGVTTGQEDRKAPASPHPAQSPRKREKQSSFRPWLANAGDEIPAMEVSGEVVVAWLQRMALSPDADDTFTRKPDPAGMDRIRELVVRWPGAFVKMAKSVPNYRRPFFLHALIHGLPDERAGEVLREIPKAPELMPVVEARGWEADAKRYVLQAVLAEGRIPAPLAAVCRGYRDPAFHPAMRASFTPDVPTVRYWESMPDLAPELEARLAPVKAEVLRGELPFTGEEMAVLLHRGDREVLGFLLKGHPLTGGLPRAFVQEHIRDPDGSPLHFDGSPEDPTTNTRAEDYVFDPATRRFLKKTTSEKP